MLTPFITLASIKDVWCGEFATSRFPKPLREAQSDLTWISFRRDLQLPEGDVGAKYVGFFVLRQGLSKTTEAVMCRFIFLYVNLFDIKFF